MSTLGDQLFTSLERRRSDDAFRQRTVMQSACQPRSRLADRACLNFSSNDYLGLANNAEVKQAVHEAIDEFGVGAGASHLVTGHHLLHEQLERALAEQTGREAALLFASGFQANQTVIQTLLGRHDKVFQDRLNHASLIDGAQSSGAKLVRYRHGDMQHLEELLNKNMLAEKNTEAQSRRLIVSDSVFSMDGDIAPVQTLAKLAQANQAILMLDDAHGFGVLGESGMGIVESENLSPSELPVLMATLGKAVGVCGAFVAGSRTLIETLVNEGRPYIYSTAMPPALAAGTMASLQLIKREPERRNKLRGLIERFKRGLGDLGLQPGLHGTPIQILVLGSNRDALEVSKALLERGILVSAIRPPTVPVGSARLRVTFSAAHENTDVDELLTALEDILRGRGLLATIRCSA